MFLLLQSQSFCFHAFPFRFSQKEEEGVFTYFLLVVIDQRSMLQVRVEFDLVDRRRRLGCLEDPV
jgi:hypothetical protein